MRFLVDECLPRDIETILADNGHDALHVLEPGLRSSNDEQLWEFAATEDRVLVTADLDFPLTDLPRPPGLVLLRFPDKFSRVDIAALFREFVVGGGLATAVDAIVVVEPGRVRVRRFDDLGDRERRS